MIEGKKLVELSYDIQSGLGNTDVPDFDSMRTMGMSATLAIHLRGLPEIEYDVLRKVSDYFFLYLHMHSKKLYLYWLKSNTYN